MNAAIIILYYLTDKTRHRKSDAFKRDTKLTRTGLSCKNTIAISQRRITAYEHVALLRFERKDKQAQYQK